jgi:hypothetical protein
MTFLTCIFHHLRTCFLCLFPFFVIFSHARVCINWNMLKCEIKRKKKGRYKEN